MNIKLNKHFINIILILINKQGQCFPGKIFNFEFQCTLVMQKVMNHSKKRVKFGKKSVEYLPPISTIYLFDLYPESRNKMYKHFFIKIFTCQEIWQNFFKQYNLLFYKSTRDIVFLLDGNMEATFYQLNMLSMFTLFHPLSCDNIIVIFF